MKDSKNSLKPIFQNLYQVEVKGYMFTFRQRDVIGVNFFQCLFILALFLNVVTLEISLKEGKFFQQAFASDLKQLSIASGIEEIAQCSIVSDLVEIINRQHIGINAKIVTTGGSKKASVLVGSGKIDLGIVDGHTAYLASHGIGVFRYQKQPLAALIDFPYEIGHVLATEKSGIQAISELKGRRVAVGIPKSRTNEIARMVLNEYRLSGKVNEVPMGLSDTFIALKKGTVDAAFIYTAYLSKNFKDLSKYRNIKLLSVENKFLKRILRKYPGYSKFRVPRPLYSKTATEILWVSNPAVIIARNDMDNILVNKIVKAIVRGFQGWEYMKACPMIDLQSHSESPFYFHPGATMAFQELLK